MKHRLSLLAYGLLWSLALSPGLRQPQITEASAPPPQSVQPLPQERPPVFRTSVDLVSVDVNVVDQNGRPVPNLSVDDFVLSVDRRPRKIVSAQFVPIGRSGAAAPATGLSTYSSTNLSPAGRLIMLVVDRGSITPTRFKNVFAAASRFVASLDSTDLVALVAIPSGARIDFTSNHAIVRTALEKMDGEAFTKPGLKGIGVADALKMQDGNSLITEEVVSRECGDAARSELLLCRNLVRQEAAILAADVRQRTLNTISGLQSILERLGTSETPKILVLVSEGLVIEGHLVDLAWIGPAAARAHATLYALQPEASDSDASRGRPPAGLSQDRTLRHEGLNVAASLARGEVFRVIADPDVAFQRLGLELSGYYLLGFEPETGDRDGKPHPIRVEVRRDNVSVRARPEFTVGPAATKSAEQTIAEILRTPISSTDIPLKVTTYTFQDPNSSKLRLMVAAEVDRSLNLRGRVSLGYVLIDTKGAVAATWFEPDIAAPAEAGSRFQRTFGAAIVDPGEYTLKLAAVDDEGRRGSVARSIRAYMTRLGPVRATDLLIAEGAEIHAAGGTIAPTVSAEFSGGTLHTYLELFSETSDALRTASVTMEVAATETGEALGGAVATLQVVAGNENCRAAGASVPLGLLPPGEYVARAVINVEGRPVGQITRPFRIIEMRR